MRRDKLNFAGLRYGDYPKGRPGSCRENKGEMRRYSVFAIAREAMRAHKGLGGTVDFAGAALRSYDVIIVGAGGHGLGAAYYLAKEHGITNVAVIEKGWLGGGNTGRNTTIIRSNYLYEESMDIYEHSLKLWEDLSQDLNYNVMYSPRGADDAVAQHP